MTLKRLNALKEGLEGLRDLEQEINIKMDSIPGGEVSGVPSGKNKSNSKEQQYISGLREKENLQKRYEQMKKDYSDAYEYINNVSEHTLYLIFYRRFILGYSWTKVAMKCGGNNTGDTVRMRVIRYLEKN